MPPEITLLDLFLPIFIGMGPVKVLLVYMALTRNSSTALQRKVARKTIFTGTIIAIRAFGRRSVYHETPALYDRSPLNRRWTDPADPRPHHRTESCETKEQSDPVSEEAVMSMAIYPLAIPLLLNPVGIVSLTVFSAEAQGLLQIGLLIIMVLIVAAIDLRCVPDLSPSRQIPAKERILVLEKLLGIFLAALAVQLMIDGLVDLHIISVLCIKPEGDDCWV